jgi:hypothetical protein
VAVEFGDDFFFGKRVELFEKDDGGARVFSLLAFGLEFVADFSGADQDAVGVGTSVSGMTFRKFL